MLKIALLMSALVAPLLQAEEEGVTIEKVADKQFAVAISETQKKAIEEIVTTLGTSSVIALGFKKGHLKSLGGQLKGIGSLNFLGYIFSRDDLRTHMKAIQRSSIKWDAFIDGLKDGFDNDTKSGKLSEQLASFATFVNADYTTLSTVAQKRDWEAFVSSIIEGKKK